MKTEMRNEIEKFVTAYFGSIESGRKYRMDEFVKHPLVWNRMIEVEKTKIEKMGADTKALEAMVNFFNYLKEQFGYQKAALLIGMLGNYEIYSWTGYMMLSEDNFKNMTVEELKADIEELYEEAKFED